MKWSSRVLGFLLVVLMIAAAVPTAVLAQKSDIKLTFSYWGSTYEKAVIEAAIKSFTEKTGIEVEPMIIPTDYETKLTTMIAANDAPDVGYLGPPTAYKWFKDGHLYDIKGLFESDPSIKEEDFIDGAIFRYGDSIIGVMNNLESFAIFYSKEAFAEAGIDNVPTKPEDAWTWDEFVEIAKLLTIDRNGRNANDPTDPKNIRQYGVYMGLWSGP